VTNNNGFCIGWLDLLTPSCTISRNHNHLQEHNFQPNHSSLTAEDSLHSRSRSHSTTDVWFTSRLFMSSRDGSIENISVAQQWIYANHMENTSSSIVVFTARCIATEVIRLLPAYSLSRKRAHWIAAQQRVHMSQYWQKILIHVTDIRARRWDYTSNIRTTKRKHSIFHQQFWTPDDD
jgi:hypothetical protein